MKRRDVINEITQYNGMIVSNLGFPSRELYDVADSPRNFYMLGSMGLASSIGLGLAMSRKDKVYVIDGDGSVLMNLGSLVTIAHHAPDNFCLIIIDNKVYGSTGNQPTYTANQADLKSIALGAGNENVALVKNISELRESLKAFSNKRGIIIAETTSDFKNVPIIPYDPVEIKERFMEYLKG